MVRTSKLRFSGYFRQLRFWTCSCTVPGNTWKIQLKLNSVQWSLYKEVSYVPPNPIRWPVAHCCKLALEDFKGGHPAPQPLPFFQFMPNMVFFKCFCCVFCSFCFRFCFLGFGFRNWLFFVVANLLACLNVRDLFGSVPPLIKKKSPEYDPAKFCFLVCLFLFLFIYYYFFVFVGGVGVVLVLGIWMLR